MGHHRPVRAARGAVPRAGCGPLHGAQRATPQSDLRVHSFPLVFHLRRRFAVVLP